MEEGKKGTPIAIGGSGLQNFIFPQSKC